jgi:hypothetical protein
MTTRKERESKFLAEAIVYSLANYGEGSCVTRCEYEMAKEIVRLRALQGLTLGQLATCDPAFQPELVG